MSEAWWLKPGEQPNFQTIPRFLTPSDSTGITVPWDQLEKTFNTPGNNFVLEPEFQRGHVWTRAKQEAYIEFRLQRGLGAQIIYWNWPLLRDLEGACVDINPEEIVLVDGLQRITAVRAFLRGDIHAFGFPISAYGGVLRHSYCRFDFVYNTLVTYDQILEWYLQLNSGGVVHSEAELARVRALLLAQKSTPKESTL